MYEERGNLKMRKKIIATLLAVSLLVSLAMPAFASTNSSQSGDSSEVTMVAFEEKMYTIPKNGEKDFAGEVDAFVDKDQLVIDPNLTYELTDDTTGTFAISGSTVYAVEKTGSATLVVKNIDDKKVGSVKITAGAEKVVREATGFRFVSKTNDIPAESLSNSIALGVDAGEFIIKVAPTPSGSKFNPEDKTTVETAVMDALKGSYSNLSTTGTVDGTDAKATYTIDLADCTVATTGITHAFGIKLTTPVAFTATADGTADALVLELKKISDSKYDFTAEGTGSASAVVTMTAKENGVDLDAKKITDSKITGLANASGAMTVVTENTVVGDKETTIGINLSALPELDADNNIQIKVHAGAFDLAALNKYNADSDKSEREIIVTETLTSDEDGTTRETTAKAIVNPVAGKVAIGVTAPSSIKIEVGEEYKLHEKVKHVSSDANIKSKIKYDEEYINDDAADYDYAIVSDTGVVTGVAVGKNKVVSTISYMDKDGSTTKYKYATTIVEVVAKGTLPTNPDESTAPAINPTVNMMAGGTYKINVKNADASKVTFSSYNPKVATVANDGTVKAMANGTTKIAVMIDGSETLYVTLTVKDMPKPVDPTKPTTPPATGVGA